MPLSKKERDALPKGLPVSAHDKLVQKFGVLALYHLVHPKGNKEKLDALRQFADCQTNLIAQTDLYHDFQERFDETKRDRILQLLADFHRDHAREDENLNNLRTMEDVLGDKPWNEDLMKECEGFGETYRINQLAYTLNVDVLLRRDVGGAIGNWTVVYNHEVYDDADSGKPKDQVTVTPRRPLLKKEASQLARKYTADRLLECTSAEYQATPDEDRLKPWQNVAEQIHALLPRIVSTIEQKNGPSVKVGALLPETAAWLIVNLADGYPLIFNFRRRVMKPMAEAQEPLEPDEEPAGQDEGEGDPVEDKSYRTSAVFTLLAVPNKDRTDYVFREDWPESEGDVTRGFIDCISYYDENQKGTGLDSIDDEEFKRTILKMSPFLVLLPTLIAHKPHPGNAASNSPKYDLYKIVSPPQDNLTVTRTLFGGLTLGRYDPDRKQASVFDWKDHGANLVFAYHHYHDTREYDFFKDEGKKKKCAALRKQPINVAPRHFLLSTLNEAIRSGKTVMDRQREADKRGLLIGGYAIRTSTMLLNVPTREMGDEIEPIRGNGKLNAYRRALPDHGYFADLAGKK